MTGLFPSPSGEGRVQAAATTLAENYVGFENA
jgi:hypothetical protein